MVTAGDTRTFEAVLVRQCAPTLAGLKLGSIFCIKSPIPEITRQKVNLWDKQLAPLGLSVQILLERPGCGSMMIYVYRRKQLKQILSDEDCREFLEKMGYFAPDLDGLLTELSFRLKTQPEFPHEIGLFLGYPLRDVTGFIENHGRNFTCCGFWKSYGDPIEMQAYFASCRRCIHMYSALFAQGISIEKLAVPA